MLNKCQSGRRANLQVNRQLPPAGRSCFAWSDATGDAVSLAQGRKFSFAGFFFLCVCQAQNLVLALAPGLFGALRDFQANTADARSRLWSNKRGEELPALIFFFQILFRPS